METDRNADRKLVMYVLLVICGTLLSAWGWWVTTSILQATSDRHAIIAEWSTWRGGTDQKLDQVTKQLVNVSIQLEEIKVYLRSRGWKQDQDNKSSMAPARGQPPAGAG